MRENLVIYGLIVQITIGAGSCSTFSYKEEETVPVPASLDSGAVTPPAAVRLGSVSQGSAFIFVRDAHLWGVMNVNGELVQTPQFDDWQPMFKNLEAYRVSKNGKWGVLSTEGKLILPVEYDAVYAEEWTGKKYLSAVQGATSTGGLDNEPMGGRQGIYDLSGKLIIPFSYFHVMPLKNGLFLVNDGGNSRFQMSGIWGLMDSTAKFIFPLQYPYIGVFGDLVNVGGKYAKRDGTFLKMEGYEYVNWHSNTGNLKVQKNGRWGLMDNHADLIIPMDYDELGDIVHALITVNKGKKRDYDWSRYMKNGGRTDPALDGLWGLYNLDGKKILPEKYMRLVIAGPNLIVCQDEKWGAVDTTGKVIMPFEYDALNVMASGLIYTRKNTTERHFQRTPSGKIIPLNYKILGYAIDEKKPGVSIINVNGSCGLLTREGKLSDTVHARYFHYQMRADSLSEGYVVRLPDYKAGGFYLDKNLKAKTFDLIVPLEKGYLVKKKGKWGYINSAGVLQIDPLYDTLVAKSNDCVIGKKQGQWRILKKGKAEVLLDPEIRSVKQFSEGLAAVSKGGTVDAFGGLQGEKWGYVDEGGKVRIDFTFERAEEFKKGYAAVMHKAGAGTRVLNQNRWILIDKKGDQISKHDFDELRY